MRSILVALFFSFIINGSLFAEVVWLRSVEKAIDAAIKEDKPILVFVYDNNCKYCYYSVKAFKNSSIVKGAIDRKNFITVALHKSNPELRKFSLFTSIFPSYFILSKDGERIAPSLNGYVKENPLAEYLKRVRIWYNKQKTKEHSDD